MQILSSPTQWLPCALVTRPKPPPTLLLPCSGPLTRASDLPSFLLPQGCNFHLHCFLFAQLIPSRRSRRAHLNRCTKACLPRHCLDPHQILPCPCLTPCRARPSLPFPRSTLHVSLCIPHKDMAPTVLVCPSALLPSPPLDHKPPVGTDQHIMGTQHV